MVWLYEEAVKREHKQVALQTELSYHALVVSLTSVLNLAYGGVEIPKNLGLLDIFTESGKRDKKGKIKHFINNAPDVLDILK